MFGNIAPILFFGLTSNVEIAVKNIEPKEINVKNNEIIIPTGIDIGRCLFSAK